MMLMDAGARGRRGAGLGVEPPQAADMLTIIAMRTARRLNAAPSASPAPLRLLRLCASSLRPLRPCASCAPASHAIHDPLRSGHRLRRLDREVAPECRLESLTMVVREDILPAP